MLSERLIEWTAKTESAVNRVKGESAGALQVRAQFSELPTDSMPRTTREQRFEEGLGGFFRDGGDFHLVEAGVF